MAKEKTGGTLTYPKGETIWVQYHTKDGTLKYIVTTKTGDRNIYYMYELDGTGFKKLGRGKNPAELEEKYIKL